MEGWRIQEERIIREDGKFYPMMKAVHGEKENFLPGTPYTLSEWFGGMLMERRDPVLEEYLKRELRIRDRILEKLQNAPDPGQRLEEVREEKRMILTHWRNMKAYELISWLEKKYPTDAAEDWDNVGLLTGDDNTEVSHVFLALDLTEETLAEAIENGADMILTHHPMIFSGIKKINNS